MTRPTSTQREHLRQVIARSGAACGECGEPIDYTLPTPHPDSFELDHKVPLSQGGRHTLDNVRATHRRCNRAKSDKPFAAGIVRRSGALD